MLNKHFFKILIAFAGMLALGLAGIAVINQIDKNNDLNKATAAQPKR